MYYDQIIKKRSFDKLGANIPPQAYILTEDGVSNLAKLTHWIETLLQAEKNDKREISNGISRN